MNKQRKLAVITGASSGIGAQTAHKLAIDGFDLLLLARRDSLLQQLAETVSSGSGVNVDIFACDLLEPLQLESFIRYVSELQRPIHVLVNNAGGITNNAPYEALDSKDWRDAFQLNFFSVIDIIQGLLPFIAKQDNGRIINVSSINAKTPGFMNPHYCAAKAALNNFTKYLSRHVGPDGITVNTVSPGIIVTEGWSNHVRKLAPQEAESESAFIDGIKMDAGKGIALKRVGEASEVANTIAFVASDGASYIHGADIVVDGGKRTEI